MTIQCGLDEVSLGIFQCSLVRQATTRDLYTRQRVEVKRTRIYPHSIHHIRASEDVSKLSDIAWPAVGTQNLNRLVSHVGLGMEAIRNDLREELEIALPRSEGWKINAEDIQTKEEVFAEPTLTDLSTQFTIGCRQHAYIRVVDAVTPDPTNLTALETP